MATKTTTARKTNGKARGSIDLACLRGAGASQPTLLRQARAQEEAAMAAGRGLWQTTFEPPWEYRAHRWEVATQQAPEGCPIKGNISRDGERIYHAPWGSQWYDRTKISADQDERWFLLRASGP